jgi:hypothetical protein
MNLRRIRGTTSVDFVPSFRLAQDESGVRAGIQVFLTFSGPHLAQNAGFAGVAVWGQQPWIGARGAA